MTPKLRFPEFKSDWRIKRLDSISNLSAGGTPSTRNLDYWGGHIKWMSSGDLNKRIIYDVDGRITQLGLENSSAKLIPENSVLIGLAGQGKTRGTVAINKVELTSNQSVAHFKNITEDYQFVYFSLFKDYVRLRRLSTGDGGRGGLNLSILGAYKVSFPEITEQLKISKLLVNVDQKINLLTKKKEALETYKKGLMQKIFSQELRFKREDGTDYPEWKTFKLSEVLIEHKKRSDGSEQVHSVSVHKGVVNQIEHLGRSFAAKDVSNYNKVLFGDIIYTKSPTGDFPYGIIKQSYVERAIVSPLYCVTSPIDINIGYLLNWFFESKINVHNYLHPIIQKGAKNTINITNTTFLSRSLSLPSDLAERQKIKDMYSSLNDNLRTLESEILKVTEFKKGLLQQMFV
jgi:type I restriction enzyme S subunit